MSGNVGAEAFVEENAPRCKLIQVRAGGATVTITAQVIRPESIQANKYDVDKGLQL